MNTRKPKVLLAGDFMQDVYHVGSVARCAPEAPVPVVKITEKVCCEGGAGNVRKNLLAMGVDTFTQDAYRKVKPTKNRLMVGDVQVARWDEDDTCYADDAKFIVPYMLGLDALVISDYGKGTVSPEIIERLAEITPAEMPVFIDSKRGPRPFRAFKRRTFFPNAAEFAAHFEDYGDELAVVVKRGCEGLEMRFSSFHIGLGRIRGYPVFYSFPSQAKFVRSVNGAGDTVMASYVAFALSDPRFLRSGMSGADIQNLGNYVMSAAAVAVESPYTTVVSAEQIEARLQCRK